MKFQRLGLFWFFPGFALLLLSVVVVGLLLPGEEPFGLALSFPWLEPLGFLVLAAMLVGAFQLRWPGALLVFGVAGLLAGLLEAAQMLSSYRAASWTDWVSNVVGIGLGVLLGGVIGLWLHRLLPNPKA